MSQEPPAGAPISGEPPKSDPEKREAPAGAAPAQPQPTPPEPTPPKAAPPEQAKPSPPPAPEVKPLSLPRTIKGKWKRDLRLGGELVGKGEVKLTASGISVRGRRSSPFRTAIWGAFWLSWWFSFLASGLAGLMTVIGIANRSQSLEVALTGATCIFPVILIGGLFARWLARRLLEPPVRWTVPWGDVTHLAAGNKDLDLKVLVGGNTWIGRLSPRRSAYVSQTLAGIRAGAVPQGQHARGWHRPAFIDKLLLVGVLAGLGAGAWKIEPELRRYLQTADEARSGPLAGIPDPVSDGELLPFQASCPGRSGQAQVHNRRAGSTLVIDAKGLQGNLLHLRWQAGSKRIQLVESTPARSTQLAGFFTSEGQLAITLHVPSNNTDAVKALVARGDLEDVRTAWCAGLVTSYDITQTLREQGRVEATRQGDDLNIQVSGVGPQTHALLVTRWLPSSGPDDFQACALPIEGQTLGLLKAYPERDLKGFFDDPKERARVYLVEVAKAPPTSAMVEGGKLQPCAVPHSLQLSGAATAWTATPEVLGSNTVRERARQAANTPPMVPMTTSTTDLVDAISGRYAQVSEELRAVHLSPSQQLELNRGFLDAVPWNPVLESASFSRSLPHLEVLRQRLSGKDPSGEMGELFLLGFAEAFLANVPLQPRDYAARVEVGEAWMKVRAGTLWTLNGRRVRVPDAKTAAIYQLVGRYVLVDVARHLERDISAEGSGEVPREYRALATRLEAHKIRIDPKKSTSTKAVEAWLKGDFEYLANRALKKAGEGLSDQQASVSAAWQASYEIKGTGGDRERRYASLVRNGRQIGWVAQFTGRGNRLHYIPAAQVPPRKDALTRHTGSPLLLATAGSYVTADGVTSGLSVVQGQVQNYLISHQMDGLVILHPSKGLTLLDMEVGGKLPGTQETIQPLRSLADLQVLLSWLEKERASAFQTHLLVAQGGFTIDEATAAPDLRERRLLVEASYKQSPLYAIVDLPSSPAVTLFEATIIAKKALETPEARGGPGWTVSGVANLDVGSFDILEAWDQRGRNVRSGRVPLENAHNLLVVSQ